MTALVGGLVSLVIVSVCFGANFYLFSQWLVYPTQRRRFRVCKPYLLIGWVLYLIGGAVIRQFGRTQNSEVLETSGNLVAFIGLGLTVYAAIRLFRANAAQRRAARIASMFSEPASEGSWPPPPNRPGS